MDGSARLCAGDSLAIGIASPRWRFEEFIALVGKQVSGGSSSKIKQRFCAVFLLLRLFIFADVGARCEQATRASLQPATFRVSSASSSLPFLPLGRLRTRCHRTRRPRVSARGRAASLRRRRTFSDLIQPFCLYPFQLTFQLSQRFNTGSLLLAIDSLLAAIFRTGNASANASYVQQPMIQVTQTVVQSCSLKRVHSAALRVRILKIWCSSLLKHVHRNLHDMDGLQHTASVT